MPIRVSTLTVRERRSTAILALADILTWVRRGGEYGEGRFRWLRMLLEALPLGTDEFCTAVNRLDNGRRYLEEGETGAALYELQMLLRWLVATK